MAENEIFWLGGRPGQPQHESQLAEDERFVAKIREAVEQQGFLFDRVVSAQGPYGTWLAEYRSGDKNRRVLWNGKDEIMVLQYEREIGGWDEPREIEVESRDIAGFAAAVSKILAEGEE